MLSDCSAAEITSLMSYTVLMGAAIFLWIIFIGWLMWSSKADKEVFLFYAWASMIVIGALGWIYESIFGPIT